MMVTSVRGPDPCPGNVTLRLWSTNVTTRIPTANGECGFGAGGADRVVVVLAALAVCAGGALAFVGGG
jgi:hypothetical protein